MPSEDNISLNDFNGDDLADPLHRGIDPDENLLNAIYCGNDNFQPCELYTIDRFNTIFKSDPNLFNVFNFNIRSYNKNGDAFVAFLNTINVKPDIIVITETWMSEANSSLCSIDGYIPYHSVRGTGRGGGVSVYCVETLNSNRVDNLSIVNDTIETCLVKLSIGNELRYVLSVYRPHSDSIENFTAHLGALLSNEVLNAKKVILTGDLNINLLSNDVQTTNICNMMRSFNFVPVISKPTRFPSDTQTNVNPSLLDHIWINSLEAFTGAVLVNDITDHCLTLVRLPMSVETHSKIKISFRDHNPSYLENFINEVTSLSANIDDRRHIDGLTAKFVTELDAAYCRCFPLREKYVKVKRLQKPWITPGILKSVKTKSMYFKLFKLGLISAELNRVYRNKLNIVVRQAKRQYFNNVFDCVTSDIKRTWHHLRYLLGRNKSDRKVEYMDANGIRISGDKEIAEVFSEYFASVAVNLDREIPHSAGSPLQYVNRFVLPSMYMKPMTADECRGVICGLKNKYYGIHSPPVKIIKKARTVIAEPISKLFNISVQQVTFPHILKYGTIVPIFKSGDYHSVSCFRPITLLTLLSKIFEKAIETRIRSFVAKHSILSPHQFGFQRGRSTADAISCLTEKIYNSLDSKEFNCTLFVDLKKAFDTVNHQILFNKLYRYGIRGVSLEIIQSYLLNRVQRVRIGNCFSDDKITNIGVPQGSILGPLLFLLYVNDLPNVAPAFSSILFADDTTLTCSNSNLNNLIESVNENLDKIKKWTYINRLSLNINKTYYMLFTNRPVINENHQISLDGVEILNQTDGKFLGLRLDNKCNFSLHISDICSKVAKAVGILYKIQNCVPNHTLLRLYYSLIYPYLTYCIMIWGGSNHCHLNQLILLQKRAVRVVSGAGYLEHTGPLFRRLNLLKIKDIYFFTLAIQMYKFVSSGVPEPPNHNHNTRNRDNLPVTFRRLTRSQQAVSFRGPHVWNSLPAGIQSAPTLSSFKRKLKTYLVEQYGV